MAKAQLYYGKLPVADRSLKQLCIRMGIQLDDIPVPCDADALVQKADDHLQTGMDAAALMFFERAMQCRPDPTLYRKAFMAACRSKNEPKANVYYGKLLPDERSSLAQLCIRNGIQVGVPQAAATKPACQPADAYDPLNDRPICTGGVIKIASTPPAKIYLDGVDTGKTTPATLQATVGKHRITFVVGNDKYTYVVSAKAGETTSLTKDLR